MLGTAGGYGVYTGGNQNAYFSFAILSSLMRCLVSVILPRTYWVAT
jgi:hypothetical protein